MVENWLSFLAQLGPYLVVCCFDFSEVFDHNNYTILIKELLNTVLRNANQLRQSRIVSFVLNRELTSTGIPHGIKVGLIPVAIMINVLVVKSPLITQAIGGMLMTSRFQRLLRLSQCQTCNQI